MTISRSSIHGPLAVSIHFGSVSADMCQDLCIGELGRGVVRGSWRKNNNDCQCLFWASALKRGICVFDGAGACLNRYLVLCREATARLGQVPFATTTSTTVKPVATTTTRTMHRQRPAARLPEVRPPIPWGFDPVELSLH